MIIKTEYKDGTKRMTKQQKTFNERLKVAERAKMVKARQSK